MKRFYNEHPDKHLEIVLRNIGHQVLLHSKDSTSRVLPIETVNENTFRISFENSFEFTPDTLMNLVHQQLVKTDRFCDHPQCGRFDIQTPEEIKR